MGVILGIMLNGGALAPPQAREPRRSRTPSFLQARACRQHEKGGSWSMVDACGDCVALAFEQELYDVDYKPACISPTLDRTPWSPSGLLALRGHPAPSLPVLGKGEGRLEHFGPLPRMYFVGNASCLVGFPGRELLLSFCGCICSQLSLERLKHLVSQGSNIQVWTLTWFPGQFKVALH